jgi:DnaJ homolog subfamily C member 3
VEKYCEEALGLDSGSFWGRLYSGKKLLKNEDYEGAVRVLQEIYDEVAEDGGQREKTEKVSSMLQKAKIALKRSKTKDYYKVLGVANDADEMQIKSAWRKASKKHHPDKAIKQGVPKEQAEKKMAAINEAYEVLIDPELRARFDRGDDPNSQEQQGNPFQGSPFGGGHPFGGGGFGGFPFQHQGGGGNRKFHFNF